MATTSASRWSVARRPRREHRHAAFDGLDRLQPKLATHDGKLLELADRRHLFVVDADRDDEVRDEDAVRVEPRADVLSARRDENAAVGGDGRDGGAAAVEDDEVGRELLGQAGSRSDVRARDLAGQPSAAAPAADRANSGQRRRLQVVGGGVTSRSGQLQQAVERRRSLDQLRLGGAAAAHRDDDESRSRESTRASWPVSAVFPIRLPVPITASDGSENGS